MSKQQKYAREAPADFSFYEWRQEMGYTQVEAAHVLGIGPRTVTYYEHGRSVSWPLYLACRYAQERKRAAERMADEQSEQEAAGA